MRDAYAMSRAIGLTTQKNYRLLLYVYSLVIVLLGVSFAACAVVWSLPGDLGEGYHNVQAMLRGIQQVLFLRISLLYTVTTLLIVIAMVILHLLYSHRIAGPAYRIGLEAAKIAQGDLSVTVRFRRRDSLMDMAEFMNDITLRYQDDVCQIQDGLATIEERSKKLDALVQEGKNEGAMKQEADEIARKCSDIAGRLAEIRT
jgi:methyl-accepting chemotaxis protein